MSAIELALVQQLLAEPTPAEKALQRIVSLYEDNDRMSCHDLRILSIALEGQGLPAPYVGFKIREAIQRKRDRIERLHGQGWKP